MSIVGIPQPRLSAAVLTLLLSIALVLFYNPRFWAEAFRLRYSSSLRDLGFLASLFLILVTVVNLLLSLLAVKHVQKPAAILILSSAALATYFTSSYGVLIDATMVRNVFETDLGEIAELLGARLLLLALPLAVLPSCVVCRTRIHYRSWLGELKVKAVTALASAAVVAAVALPYYADYASLFSQNRQLRHLCVPLNYLYGTFRYLEDSWTREGAPVLTLGRDARLRRIALTQPKKMLTILVLGETARAEEYSLNGYARATNPYLAAEPVISFENVEACGTATAVSVPCMFSSMGHDDYDSSEVKRHEGLLDVLAHAGVSVLWRDNNSGCKGVCDRIETDDPGRFHSARYCHSGECYDEVLLNRLEERLSSANRDVFIVLHLNGSHGPAYYLRYPKPFKRFIPECTTNQLQECSRQEIVNAYDNTIVYTDYVLDRVIRLLEENGERYNTAMIYVSDHGESLGENRVFLHGLPYFLAPEEQTRVPLVVWLSEGFKDAFAIDSRCLNDRRSERLSHDYLFHSVLGLMNVDTEVYDEELDIFAGCRRRS